MWVFNHIDKHLKPIVKDMDDFTVKGAVISLVSNIVKQFDAVGDVMIIKNIVKWLKAVCDGKIFIIQCCWRKEKILSGSHSEEK